MDRLGNRRSDGLADQIVLKPRLPRHITLTMKLFLPLLAGLAIAAHANAQQLPTVDQLLTRVTAYAQQYRQSVPSFEADESAISQWVKNGQVTWEVRLEMTVEEVRVESKPDELDDRYTFHLIDGKPPKKHFKLPYFAHGVFANALGFGHPEQNNCFDFRVSPGDSSTTVELEMAVKPAPLPPNCADIPDEYRKITIVDTATGRVLHVTRSMSARAAHERHEIVFVSVDYAPQKLGDETFWLPVRFESHDGKNEGRLLATYSNFHRYTSTAKVVDGDSPPQVVQ